MTLRERILHALYGGALVSTAAISMTACGEGEVDTNKDLGWMVNNATPDMSTDLKSPVDQGPGHHDLAQSDQGLPGDQGELDQGLDLSAPDQGPPGDQGLDSGMIDQDPPLDQGQDLSTPDQGLPDMGPACLDPNEAYKVLPFAGWQKSVNALNGERVIVCNAAIDTAKCAEASSLSDIERNQFLADAFGVPTGCSQDPTPEVLFGGEFCGPVEGVAAQCCYGVDIQFSFCAVGRPFTVDGVARLAEVTRRDGWHEAIELAGLEDLPEALREEVAAGWAESGTHEHASVASFGRFLMDLMSLGAPLDLVQATTRAIEDEIRHARDCFSIASAYAGMPLGPDVVDVRGSMDHAGDEATILKDAILEGCIGETLAASVAGWLGPKVGDERMAEVLRGITKDEGDHAVLAWRFVDWMLTERPHLIGVARATFESVRVDPTPRWAEGVDVCEIALVRHGHVRAATEERLRLSAYRDTVKPCIEALFRRHDVASVQAAEA